MGAVKQRPAPLIPPELSVLFEIPASAVSRESNNAAGSKVPVPTPAKWIIIPLCDF